MANEDKLSVAIRMIKAGHLDAARAVLEPFLLENPSNIQAWFWEAELSTDPLEKITVLEACLRRNPGHPQVLQALAHLKNQTGVSEQSVAPTPRPSTYSPPPPVYPEPGVASYRTSSPVKPDPTVSPFSGSQDWLDSAKPASAPRSTDDWYEPEVPAPQRIDNWYEPEKASPQQANTWLDDDGSAAAPQSTNNLFDDEDPIFTPEPTPTAPPLVDSSQRSQPASPKKPIRLTPQLKTAILVILGCLACILFSGLYVGGGYYLNGQVNQSFAVQNCAEVVQQTLFVSIYPQGLFGSMFTGYDQYNECRLKVGVEQAVAAKNWGEAISLSQQYLAAYPNGTFSGSLSEQTPTFFTTWADELVASYNYTNSIEKLKQLVETYPDSPAAQTAPESILQTYFLWTKGLVDKQNYKDAEYPLKSALTYFQADPVRAEQVTQVLVNLYVVWGDQQIQLGDIDNAINTYKKAGEVSPGAVDVELLIARAHLRKALNLIKTKNFDKALSNVKEVADAAQADNIKTEAEAVRTEILTAYSVSTSPQAMEQMTAAITLTCQGQRPELPIFGLDPEKIRFGFIHPFITLPAELTAERPSELRYVICSTETEEQIQTCKYSGGFSLARMRYIWRVQLYDQLSGESAASKNIKGADPAACPPQAYFLAGSSVSKSYGKRPTVDDFVAWLAQLKLTK